MSDRGPSFATAVGRSDRRTLVLLVLLAAAALAAAPLVALHALAVIRRQQSRRGRPTAGTRRTSHPKHKAYLPCLI